LRRSNIDAGAIEEVARIVGHIRSRWPRVRILLRADAGFAREELMRWYEHNGVDFLFGLAKNARLTAAIAAELGPRASAQRANGQASAALQGLCMVDAGQLEPVAPRHRQGRVNWRRGQPALCRHLAQARAGRGTASLRNDLLRAR
jgi:hypothetical protein